MWKEEGKVVMGLATICFGVAGEHTVGSLGDSLTALDRLLSALEHEYATAVKLRREIVKLDAEDDDLHIQLDLLSEGDTEVAERVGAAYWELAVGLAAGMPAQAPAQEALQSMLAACPADGAVRFSSGDAWLGVTPVRAGRASLSVFGEIEAVQTGADAYATVGGAQLPHPFRCYLTPAQSDQATAGIAWSVYIDGRLARDDQAPGGIAIRGVETLNLFPPRALRERHRSSGAAAGGG